ncbi:MAG: Type 1 glutamine amidotransferase-like domain-containing protein [Candidatus Woesearchaeota archaeon]
MSKVILMSLESVVAQKLVKEYSSKNPRIIFIKTASNVSKGDLSWLDIILNTMRDVGFDLILYDLEGKKIKDFEKDFQDVDGIHLGGGYPNYLLHHIRKSGLDIFLNNNKNKFIISGASAGAVVLSPSIENSKGWDWVDVKLDSYEGLGFVNFEILPHYGDNSHKKSVIKCFEESTKLENNGMYLTDYAYVVMENGWFKLIDVRDNK